MANHTAHYELSHSLLARSDVIDVDPSLAPLFFSENVVSTYFGVAFLTVILYNAITTIDKEVKYIWSKPTSSASLIYFANRYIGIFGYTCNIVEQSFHVNLSSCKMTIWANALCNFMIVVLIDYILLLRVLPLYDQSKRLSICLKLLLTAEVCTGLSILIYGTSKLGIVVGRLAPGVQFCAFDNDPVQILGIISWIAPMTYGTILLCLALFKSAEYWRMSHGFKGFHLVKVLIQDQILYFGFVIFCCATQIAELTVRDISQVASYILNSVGSLSLLCVLGCHLLINLKEAAEWGVSEGTNYRPSLKTVSNIGFVEGFPVVVSNDESTSSV